MKFQVESKNGKAEISVLFFIPSTRTYVSKKISSESEMIDYLKGIYGEYPVDGTHRVAVVGPFTDSTLEFDTEGIDSWRHSIYAMSEGEIHIDGKSKNVHGQRFIACSVGDLASYLMTMACEYAKSKGLSFGAEFNRSEFFRVQAMKRLVPATKEQERDSSIKWTMEGGSKYGRRMVNYEHGIWRGLTMSEFYGGGVVD